ncbi:hypothetical protein O181_049090 [Austropuccinia psidii MF-1]|uniref:type I protein arginine methyltransferase n=1 Tax=Austropuccinia psidii MF-1 TaxID=1389203 RepID=A0A9Q3DYH2_9BASI|nr:hypothetical protein [Austropuccinia psidii MF-1]
MNDYQDDNDHQSDSSSRSDQSFNQIKNEKNDWEDWIEDMAIPTKTLIYPSILAKSVEDALQYDLNTHKFCFKSLIKRLNLDDLSRIKLINWIRAGDLNSRPKQALDNLTGSEEFFINDSNQWLIPQIQKDGLLQFDFDDDSEDHGVANSTIDSPSQTTVPSHSLHDLKQQLKASQEEINLLRSILSRNMFDYLNSKSSQSTLVFSDSAKLSNSTAKPSRDDDSHYFSSYAHDSIHCSMIKDHVRTNSYREFIISNPQIFKNKRIMDIGCGTGILSFFAARAGAKKVYAIDASQIAINAAQHVKQNQLTETVKVIKKKVEDLDLNTDLEGEKVDVIVSEWMGYACLYEVFLPSVLFARDHFMKPAKESGLMAPSQCSILMAGWGDQSWWNERVSWWDENQYGFKMGSTMTERLFKEGLVESMAEKSLLTNAFPLRDIHTSTMSSSISKCIAFTTEFTISVKNLVEDNQMFHGFVVWFDTFFTTDGRLINSMALEKDLSWKETATEVAFSTSPKATDTHWYQTLLVIKEPFQVRHGTTISGIFNCSVNPENGRELMISITWQVLHEDDLDPEPQRTQMWNV